MEQQEPPTPPEKSTSQLLGLVVAINFGALLVLGSLGGIVGMLALPVLNVLVGIILLFGPQKKLGKVLLISGLVVALLGLGTCALILSNLNFNGH
ncbi:hypothetical protein [Hymenobacter guriensis]|uniref:DUF4190 domain-containing protein n=1 Tax=Hymenobacter guriensis TaxID=2793065 RepID=A0ABS0L190_9BACT|nr:hypothetical protein [Hymenobacter guriensis]MBG8553880.1 hypothetical protein [Hymenobacter guriensis]